LRQVSSKCASPSERYLPFVKQKLPDMVKTPQITPASLSLKTIELSL
jgi:hypothetical protein